MKEKQDVEKLLREKHTVSLPLTGLSMYPFLIGGRDRAIVSPLKESETPKKGEVYLYRRKQGILVLHRLVKVRDSGLFFTGDNQREIEGPLSSDQLRGRMTGFVRKGKEHGTSYFPYRFCTGLWRICLPLRPAVWKTLKAVRGIFRR